MPATACTSHKEGHHDRLQRRYGRDKELAALQKDLAKRDKALKAAEKALAAKEGRAAKAEERLKRREDALKEREVRLLDRLKPGMLRQCNARQPRSGSESCGVANLHTSRSMHEGNMVCLHQVFAINCTPNQS
jgi:hypothetical protein